MPASSSKRSSEPIADEPRFGPVEPKPEIKHRKDMMKKEKKSRNPFLNIKEFIK